MIARLEAHLDPDGVAPREEDLRGKASLRMFQRAGMLHITAVLDPERAAAGAGRDPRVRVRRVRRETGRANPGRTGRGPP